MVGRAQRERATHVGAVHHDLQRLRRREAVGPCVGDRRRGLVPVIAGRAVALFVSRVSFTSCDDALTTSSAKLGEAGSSDRFRWVSDTRVQVLPVDLTDRQVEQVGGRGFVVDVEPDVVAPDALAVCVGAQDGGAAADRSFIVIAAPTGAPEATRTTQASLPPFVKNWRME